jgi:hypothetical protein
MVGFEVKLSEVGVAGRSCGKLEKDPHQLLTTTKKKIPHYID